MNNILETIDLHYLGELLQRARKNRGMTQAEAAEIINAARTTLVAIEKGERRIKAGELIKLARAYGCSVSDFLGQQPRVEPFEVQFRSLYRQGEGEESEIKPIIGKLEDFCKGYLELEKLMQSPLPRNYPQEYDVSGMPIEATAESIAFSERQRLGLGDAPISKLRDILEQGVGLRVFYLPMPAKYSGIYSYSDQLGGCIAVNANHYEERRRWSLAHEYLHFLSHRRRPIYDYDGQYQKQPESERLAETFPKYFLMPTSSILKRFSDITRTQGKFTTTNLFTFSHYYGVSVQALTYRLEEMKLLPTGTWDKLSAKGLKVKQVQRELQLEDLPQRVDIAPIHYQHLAIEAFDQGLITEGQFANFLGIDRLESRRLAELLRQHSSGATQEITPLDSGMAQV